MVKILFIKICKEPMNVDRFKNNGSGVYFEEVLEKIRDIRSSEKVFCRKILDIEKDYLEIMGEDIKTLKIGF